MSVEKLPSGSQENKARNLSIKERLGAIVNWMETGGTIRLQKVNDRWCTVLYDTGKIASDPHQPFTHDTDNKYVEPFREIKKAGYTIIDLADPKQIKILDRYPENYTALVPDVTLSHSHHYNGINTITLT